MQNLVTVFITRPLRQDQQIYGRRHLSDLHIPALETGTTDKNFERQCEGEPQDRNY